MERITDSGLWWLPSDPDTKIRGTLNAGGGESPTLELSGSFAPKTPLPSGGLEDYNIVLGLHGGTPITLVAATTIRSHWTTEVPTQVLSATSALIGAHFETMESIKAARAQTERLQTPADTPAPSAKPLFTGSTPVVASTFLTQGGPGGCCGHAADA